MWIKKKFLYNSTNNSKRTWQQIVLKSMLSPNHQLSPSLITRTRQLYGKKIMPSRYGRHNNTECSLSWIIALHIRISLNPPLESNKNHAAIEIWGAAANRTVRLISKKAYQCVVFLHSVRYQHSPSLLLFSTVFIAL